jgi:uncharacterized Zn finger protein (UPF0148 family)
MARSTAGVGQPAADRDDASDRVADWSKMRDDSCPHCGAPMKNGGCPTCTHELARLSASSRLLEGAASVPVRAEVMVPAALASAPATAESRHQAATEPVTPKITFTAAERSELRVLVSAVERRIPRGRSVDGERSDLERDWDRLVRALSLGDEPPTRFCPTCGAVGMRAATRCGHCWAPLPVAAPRA